MAAKKDNITEQLRKMAKTPFEGLQAAVLSDVAENQETLMDAVGVFIVEQKKINEHNRLDIADNRKMSKENAEKITNMRINDTKAVAAITAISGGIVVIGNIIFNAIFG